MKLDLSTANRVAYVSLSYANQEGEQRGRAEYIREPELRDMVGVLAFVDQLQQEGYWWHVAKMWPGAGFGVEWWQTPGDLTPRLWERIERNAGKPGVTIRIVGAVAEHYTAPHSEQVVVCIEISDREATEYFEQ